MIVKKDRQSCNPYGCICASFSRRGKLILKVAFILKFITNSGSKELGTSISADEQIEKLKFLFQNVNAKVSIIENLKVGGGWSEGL